MALADCQAYWFDHTDDVAAGYCVGGADDGFECVVEVDACAEAGGSCNIDTCEGGGLDGESCTPINCSDGDGVCIATPLFEDKIENLNIFSKISGLFGRAYCADNGTGFAYYLRLVHPKKGVVEEVQATSEGNFVFTHSHKGKQTSYTIEIATDAGFTDIVNSAEVNLGSSGWYDVSFSATDCAGIPVWDSTVTYGESSRKKGKGKN